MCVKRHLIKIPPPKSGLFWGGGIVFWIKSSIFDFGRDKKFRPDFGIERTLPAINRPIIDQSRPENNN